MRRVVGRIIVLWGKHFFSLFILLGIIALAFAGWYRFGSHNESSKRVITTSSTLSDIVNISELSTAEFKYRGIADIYTNEKKTDIRCRVCYNAVVKAYIDAANVQIEADPQSKIFTIILPKIKLKVTIVDEQSMALLPSDSEVGISSMLSASKEDAEREALESDKLINTAQENLTSTIEALLHPLVKAEGYTLEWKVSNCVEDVLEE